MQWAEYWKKVDKQIAANQQGRGERRRQDRRKENVPVAADRRTGERRSGQDRRDRRRAS